MKFIYKPGVLVAKTKEKSDTRSKLKDEQIMDYRK